VRTAWRLDSSHGLHLRVTSSFEAQEDDILQAGHYRAGQDVFLRDGSGFELARTGTQIEVDRVNRIGRAQNNAKATDITNEVTLNMQRAEAGMKADELARDADAFCQKMQSLQPELIATLKSLGNKQLAGERTKKLSPLAILGGDSVAEAASRLLEGLPLGTNARGIEDLLTSLSPENEG